MTNSTSHTSSVPSTTGAIGACVIGCESGTRREDPIQAVFLLLSGCAGQPGDGQCTQGLEGAGISEAPRGQHRPMHRGHESARLVGSRSLKAELPVRGPFSSTMVSQPVRSSKCPRTSSTISAGSRGNSAASIAQMQNEEVPPRMQLDQ